jgi:signal transduction histidine kinase
VIERAQLGRPIRAALFLGFGLIVGIWLFTGFYFSRRIADAERQEAAINERYMKAQEVLSTVRAQMLLGSVFVRDALLDPDPTTADDYRRRLQDSYATADHALQQYVPVLDSSAERKQVTRLRGEIEEFRHTMLDVLATQATGRPADARIVLRTRVMPERDLVIRLSEQAQTLNRSAFIQQQSAVTEVYGVAQRRIWQSLGLALATSLSIALIATLYASRLENRVRDQREKDAKNTRDLQLLSAKLLNAQEDERRSIARELHDEVGQALTAIKVELALAERTVDGGGNALGDVRRMVDGALHTVRNLSHLLRPAILDDLGLVAAVDSSLKGFARRHRVRVELIQEGMDERLGPETEVAVYRIIQEALTNVSKHAQASSCRVCLRRVASALVVTVEDDGVGFDPAHLRATEGNDGLGLLGIRERAAQLRGTVRLDSNPGRGTRLTIEVPVGPQTVAAGSPAEEPPATMTSPAAREVFGG